MSRRLLALALACAGRLAAAEATDGGPLPGLPPQPRPMQVQTRPAATTTPDPRQLAADLRSLRQAIDRVDSALAAAAAPGEAAGPAAGPVPPGAAEDGERTALPPKRSAKFPLQLQAWSDGTQLVTADIERQRLEAVYREFAALLERPIDDAQLTVTQKLVTLKLTDVPWDEALDRLFGQAGIAWREEGAGVAAKLVLVDLDRVGDDVRRAFMAERALQRAAAAPGAPLACEAMFRLAEREAAAGRHLAAIRLFTRLVEAHHEQRDPGIATLVLRAIRGIANSMAASTQWGEAVAVYRTYIARSTDADPELPAVHLAAAQASMRAAEASGDATARGDAVLLLDALIERFAKLAPAANAVATARLLLGELLFAQGRWLEAERHLADYAASSASEPVRVAFWLAECSFRQGRWSEARPRYELLARLDPASRELDDRERGVVALRIGQCWLEQDPPQYARALFAFLRARQAHPSLALAPETVVAIARCYAELEHEEGAIEEFWRLLKNEHLDQVEGRDRLEQLLGGIQTSLAQYDGPIRARVLFYIAQADYRQAWRNRKDRPVLVAKAIQRYDRVLKENPPPDLRHAALLGLARVAFLGGDQRLGEHTLRELLKDATASPRDRQFAAQELGDHLRDQGRLREAISAYQGRIP